MKKIISLVIAMFAVFTFYAQSDNISVTKIEVNTDGSYKVYFVDSSNVYFSDHNATAFIWYLSYKGKRVSDYFYSNSNGSRSFSRTGFAWPDEVPVGHEKYVTAQIGKESESIHKDSRDDE